MKGVVQTVSFVANLITIVSFVLALLGIFQVVQVSLPVPENWKLGRFLLFLFPFFSTIGMIILLRDLMDREIPSYLLACVFAVAYPVAYIWLASQLGVPREDAAKFANIVLFGNAWAFLGGYYLRLGGWHFFSMFGGFRAIGFAIVHVVLAYGTMMTLDPEFFALVPPLTNSPSPS